jgi:hypothetical protein
MSRLPNGTRIRKAVFEPRDGHKIGAEGVILDSLAVPDNAPMLIPNVKVIYAVEWDDMPGMAVHVLDYKIEAKP